jgi:hypothetical protein
LPPALGIVLLGLSTTWLTTGLEESLDHKPRVFNHMRRVHRFDEPTGERRDLACENP